MKAIEKIFLENAWVGEVFAIILLVMVLCFIYRMSHKRVVNRLKKHESGWRNCAIDALQYPLYYLIIGLGIVFSLEVVAHNYPDVVLFNYLPAFREAIVILLFAWFVLRFIRFSEVWKIADGGDPSTTHTIALVGRVTVFVLAGFTLAQSFGISVAGILAFGGIGGLAVGFAAKDTLANIIGGLMLILDKPFRVGDMIRSPDKEIEGTVEQIGWRLTRVRTYDRRPLYIPNLTFSTISIENVSRMQNRRINTHVGVRYDDVAKLPAIVDDVRRMLLAHTELDQHRGVSVHLTDLAASSLNFLVYAFTKTKAIGEFRAVQEDVLLKVLAIIDKHGAECAFPTTTVHVPENISVESK